MITFSAALIALVIAGWWSYEGGHVRVGRDTYRNSYAPAGKTIIVNSGCTLCVNGIQLDDNGEPSDFCDCWTGEAVRESQGGNLR